MHVNKHAYTFYTYLLHIVMFPLLRSMYEIVRLFMLTIYAHAILLSGGVLHVPFCVCPPTYTHDIYIGICIYYLCVYLYIHIHLHTDTGM